MTVDQLHTKLIDEAMYLDVFLSVPPVIDANLDEYYRVQRRRDVLDEIIEELYADPIEGEILWLV